MSDTFKGIVTADGKKRQLPYRNILDIPISDPSLTVDGGFADAAAVGKKIKKTDDDVASLKEDLDSLPHMVKLYQNAISQGNITESNIRLLSDLVEIKEGYTLTVPDGFLFRDINYNNNYEWIGDGQWRNSVTYTDSGKIKRFNFKKTDDGIITPKEITLSTNIPFGNIYTAAKSEDIKTLQYNIDNNALEIEQNKKDVAFLQSIAEKIYSVKDLYNYKNAIYGSYYNVDGNIIESLEWYRFSIDISNYEQLFYSGVTSIGNAPGNIFMDSEGKYINESFFKLISGGEQLIKIPKDAMYLGLSIHRFDAENFKLYTKDVDVVNHSEIEDFVKENKFNLNRIGSGCENMIWSWWYYPQVVSFNRYRNKIYYNYTTSDGFTGIAAYDVATGATIKNHLKQSDIDDHNGLAIHIFNSGKVLCAFSGGHNTDKKMHVRISTTKECIENFGEEIVLECGGNTSYCQLFEYNNKLYMFYRVDNQSWRCRYSSNEGRTWSDEKTVISSSIQYYCKFAKTNTAGVIRMCLTSNPASDDSNIRMGFIHLETGQIYNSDNATFLGTENIKHTSFNIIIANEDEKTQRLFDVAITDVEKPLILYTTFTTSSDDDSAYKIYDNGKSYVLCNGGESIWHPKYQCGAAFVNDKSIACIRNSDGYDIVELYSYLNGVSKLSKEVSRNFVGTNRIRSARPIVDINGKAFLWHKGWYNKDNFCDFNCDSKIELLN